MFDDAGRMILNDPDASGARVGSVRFMGRWWTADHHFGHENIIGYCNRPFANADTMNRAMVDRRNDVVTDSDEMWILGNLVLGRRDINLGAHV